MADQTFRGSIQDPPTLRPTTEVITKTSTWVIVSLAFLFIFAIAGITTGTVALTEDNKTSYTGTFTSLTVEGSSKLCGNVNSGQCTNNTVSGTNNFVFGTGSTISAGSNNLTGGQLNTISGGTNSLILGGLQNEIEGTNTADAAIIGGVQNEMKGNNDDSFMGGGQNNNLEINTQRSGIIGGQNNGISGNQNTHSFIGGGRHNLINSLVSTGTSEFNVGIIGGTSLQAIGPSWSHSALVGQYNDPTFYPWDNSGAQALPGTCYRFAVGCGVSSGELNLGFGVDNVGNIYFGTDNGASIYYRTSATGADQYTAKAFTIQHPTINNRWLRHGCLEGPEGGVYYRGKGEAPITIQLPDYATRIASDFTVQVTPIGLPRMMSASEVSPEGSFQVYGEGTFHWNAIGERVALEAEPLKTDVTIHSVGPYSWSV